ncbi:MAG: S16 family serine protease [Thermodesulfobacteriota bacterium]|nr:S16 family serine protease [Thermodesulfobacteriota bacterium]
MSSDPKTATATWIPFTSGDLAEICIPYYRQLDADKPISVYLTGSGQHVFQEAAHRAAYSVYAWAEHCGQRLQPCYVGLDLAGVGSGSLVGDSGGVAFAVALAKRLFNKDPGLVVATGRLLAEGKIAAIDGLAEKIMAATRQLPAGGWFLFPEENFADVSDRAEVEELLDALKLSGCHVHAVSSVAETLALLFCEHEGRQPATVKNKKTWHVSRTVLLFVFLACVIVAIVSFRLVAPVSPETHRAQMKTDKKSNSEPDEHRTVLSQAHSEVPAAVIPQEMLQSQNSEPQQWVGGQGFLARELAKGVSALLQQEDGLACRAPFAELRVLGLIEELGDKGMISTLDVAISASSLVDRGKIVSLAPFQLTLQHIYPIEQALPDMARQLVVHWLKLIRPGSEKDFSNKEKFDLRHSGFEY